MRKALDAARDAAGSGEVPIGALIFDPSSKTIVATGQNAPISLNDPCAHAEIQALRMAGQVIGNYRLGGLWLYVTLEPCAMCAGAISHARIQRLIYGAPDAKGGAVDHGPKFFAQPTCHWRPEVTSGILEEDCRALCCRAFSGHGGRNQSARDPADRGRARPATIFSGASPHSIQRAQRRALYRPASLRVVATHVLRFPIGPTSINCLTKKL